MPLVRGVGVATPEASREKASSRDSTGSAGAEVIGALGVSLSMVPSLSPDSAVESLRELRLRRSSALSSISKGFLQSSLSFLVASSSIGLTALMMRRASLRFSFCSEVRIFFQSFSASSCGSSRRLVPVTDVKIEKRSM